MNKFGELVAEINKIREPYLKELLNNPTQEPSAKTVAKLEVLGEIFDVIEKIKFGDEEE